MAIRDYIGGHLSTFLYVVPLLKKQFPSGVMSNCLRNSPLWPNVEAYLAEYQCITDDDMLDKLTSVKIILKGNPPFPLADYILHRLSANVRHRFTNF
jgi:hypothetical protein